MHGYAIADPGSFKVLAGLLGVLGVAIGVDDSSLISHRTSPPDCGVSDGGAHFENALRANHEGQLVQDPRDGRPHDRHLAPCRFRLHFSEHFISRRQQRI